MLTKRSLTIVGKSCRGQGSLLEGPFKGWLCQPLDEKSKPTRDDVANMSSVGFRCEVVSTVLSGIERLFDGVFV